jgi:hypothetical protein
MGAVLAEEVAREWRRERKWNREKQTLALAGKAENGADAMQAHGGALREVHGEEDPRRRLLRDEDTGENRAAALSGEDTRETEARTLTHEEKHPWRRDAGPGLNTSIELKIGWTERDPSGNKIFAQTESNREKRWSKNPAAKTRTKPLLLDPNQEQNQHSTHMNKFFIENQQVYDRSADISALPPSFWFQLEFKTWLTPN